MTNLGLSGWVACDELSYIEKAMTFSDNFERLVGLRLGMRDRMRRYPIMDEKGLAGDVEAAYRQMWYKWITLN